MAASLEDLKKQIEDLRREYQNLTGKPAALFDVKNVGEAEAAIRTLDGSIESAIKSAERLEAGFGGEGEGEIQSILSELNKSEKASNKITKVFKGVERIARDLKDDQQGYNNLSIKDLKDRQKKLKSAQEEAKVQADIVKSQYAGTAAIETGLLRGRNGKLLNESALQTRAQALGTTVEQLKIDAEILGQQEAGFDVLERTNKLLQDRIDREERINDVMGLGGAILGSTKSALDQLGMGSLADKLGFDEASAKMREVSEGIANIDDELNSLNENNLSAAQIRAGFGGKELKDLQARKDALGGMAGKVEVLTAGFKSMGASLLKNLKDPLSIGLMLVTQLVKAFQGVDKSTGEVAKNLGMSYTQANAMVSDMTTLANLSGDMHVTTEGLVKSQLELSKALGTNSQISGELLVDFTKLTDQAGFSTEAMTNLTKISQGTGKSLQDNTAELLGQAKAFNINNGLALNEKELVEAVANTSSATVLTLGKSAKALVENAAAAKQFGINLEQAEAISSSLLNFQSSIESEMEAELLTGKQLNLEQARLLALKGETGKAAAEVLKQVGSSAEFGEMNVLAQEALAKSMGMTRDELAKSLIEREALAKIGMEDLTAQEAYNKLKKEGLSDDEIAKKLGDETLANQLKSESVQERFAAATAKLQDIFVSIAEPVLAIVSPLMDLVATVLPAINLLLQPIMFVFKTIASVIGSIVGFLTQSEELMIGLGAGAATYLGLSNKTLIIKKAEGAQTLFNNTQEKAGTAIKAAGNAIQQKGLLKSIADAAMSAYASAAKIPFIGPVLGVAAAAAALAFGYKQLSKADDLMSPGYGKRVLSAPEGTFALNDNDTVVAGTDLDQGSDQPTSPSSNSIDIAPLVAQMSQMNATLNAILAKEGTVTLDGTKVGTALTVASSKLQ